MTDFRPAGWTGQGDPDVQPVGWVTDQPGVRIRRRRSPVLLGLGGLLVAGGAVAMTVSIIGLAGTEGYADEDVVADGVVAGLGDEGGGSAASFRSEGADPYTVWIQTDGINEENHRDNVIAATACEAFVGEGDDDPATFRGNRQGTAVTINDDSTVGWFTAGEGSVTVRCHQEPFGLRRNRDRLEDEHDFLVVAGKPSAPWGSVIVLTAAIGTLVLGITVLTRASRGRIVTN